MTPRERVLEAVLLEEPDRLPVDLGSHIDSSIHRSAYANLKKHLGLLADDDATIINQMMQDVAVDEPILNRLGVDVRGLFYGSPRVNPNARRSEALPDNRYIDEWGVTWTLAPNGHYYDLHTPPLAGEIGIPDVTKYPWPDPEDPGIVDGMTDRAETLRAQTDCALVLNLPSMFVHQSQYMRGFEDWYIDLAAQPSLSEALFDAILELRMGYARRILEAAATAADIIMTADDLGTQKALQFSPEIFRRYFKPRMAKYIEMIREYTDAPILLHTCGSVYEIIEDLIDIGVNILNPVQTHAANMAPKLLKKEFGKRIAFWGAVDIQQVLPFGSPEEVKKEVLELFQTLGRGGGWVLGPSHNIQPEVPPENIVSMYHTGVEECTY